MLPGEADRRTEQAVVVTDAVFSVDGDVAPSADLHRAGLDLAIGQAPGADDLVADAHGTVEVILRERGLTRMHARHLRWRMREIEGDALNGSLFEQRHVAGEIRMKLVADINPIRG